MEEKESLCAAGLQVIESELTVRWLWGCLI